MKTISFNFGLGLVLAASCLTAGTRLFATENVPHAPFAQWADLPKSGDLVTGLNYQESEAYYIWAGSTRYNVDQRAEGEHYGIDINQGYISLQYGINEHWAADLAIGATTAGWRYFSSNGAPQSTTGLMDTALGVRYQIFKENDQRCPWKPTLTFRAGAVLPGTMHKNFPFTPGTRSTAIEPELLLRKHLGWDGFGIYADGLFRWNHTAANDLYILSVGFFQHIQRWELNAGYRHLGSVNGENIIYDPNAPADIIYPRSVRENNDSFEAGFDYTTPKRHIKMGFYTRTVFDGYNSDKKFWLGGFIEMPFSLRKSN